jgi:hypothetical protein
MGKRFQFGTRHLLLVVTVGALIAYLLIPCEARSHTAAVRNQYLNGSLILEEARREVGDMVDDWPRLKAEWQGNKRSNNRTHFGDPLLQN